VTASEGHVHPLLRFDGRGALDGRSPAPGRESHFERPGALRELLADRDHGRADLRRVVTETSGLADPAPIVFAITTDPMLRHHFDVVRLTVTVDAVNAATQLAAHPEVVKQVLVGDELVITKVDLVESKARDELAAVLMALNPAAAVRTSRGGIVDAGRLYEPAREAGARETDARVARFGRVDRHAEAQQQAYDLAATHTGDVRSLRVSLGEPMDWLGFGCG
jgi:G3E family GTPase